MVPEREKAGAQVIAALALQDVVVSTAPLSSESELRGLKLLALGRGTLLRGREASPYLLSGVPRSPRRARARKVLLVDGDAAFEDQLLLTQPSWAQGCTLGTNGDGEGGDSLATGG